VRFGALQHFRPGQSTCSRALPARYGPSPGFGYPRDGLLPAQPCRPYFMPAALLGFALQRLLTRAVELHSCNSGPTRGLRARPPGRASTSVRRVPPSLGFAPRGCPSPDRGCYSVTRPVPLLGFSSLGFVLRPAWPALQQTSARRLIGRSSHPERRTAARRIHTGRPSQSAFSPAEAGKHPALRQESGSSKPR